MAPRAASALLALGLLAAGCSHVAQSGRLPLAQVADLALPGDTSRFDYSSLDTGRHRLFVSHLGASEVVVVDTSGPSVLGVIGGLSQVHGVLVLPGLGRVLAAVTGRNEVAVIDEDSNSVVARTPTGEYPDGLAFDAADNRAFVSNEAGGSLTAFDPLTGAVLGTVELGAEVGNVVYDQSSNLLLVAVQDRNEVAVVDPRTLAVTIRHHLDGCDHSHGLAVAGQQAFVACDGNARLLVLDMASGAIRDRFTVGDDPDVLAYDPGLGRLYVMAESGVVAVLEIRNGAVSVLARRKLAAKAHSAALDPHTHAVYVPLEAAGGRPVLRVLSPA